MRSRSAKGSAAGSARRSALSKNASRVVITPIAPEGRSHDQDDEIYIDTSLPIEIPKISEGNSSVKLSPEIIEELVTPIKTPGKKARKVTPKVLTDSE